MKPASWIAVCILTFGSASAQDIITKTNTDEIEAKVLKVGNKEIEYKRWDNLDGPIYTISTRNVSQIEYRNGTKDTLSEWADDFTRKTTGYPRYQGEVAIGYALDCHDFCCNRVTIGTVHGSRINPYLFAGMGIETAWSYSDEFLTLSPFAEVKGYYPFSNKTFGYIAFDLGGTIDLSEWGDNGVYVSIGPGIDFGKITRRIRGDFSLRYQHLAPELSGVLFRIGLSF